MRRGSRSAAPTTAASTPPANPALVPLVAASLVAALCVAATATYPIYEGDFWQHLTVGKAIWEQRGVPRTHMWTWPSYGAPEVTPSWGFRAILWPVWAAGGERGLQAWRWATTLAAFGLACAACRRMGGRGFAPLLVVVLASLVYRERAQVRPETLASVLLALEIWILETRRHGGPDRAAWFVPIAWVWANAHLSYVLGLLVLGVHAVDEIAFRSRPPSPGRADRVMPGAGEGRRRLWPIALVALGASFVNPFGWRALWQPFAFLLHERKEPIFQTVGELAPAPLAEMAATGLPVLVVAWPLLFILRWRRKGFDFVEASLLVLFTCLGLGALRFLGFYAVVVAAYLGRDLDVWMGGLRWAGRAAPWARAALVACACVLVGIPTWTARFPRFGVGIDDSQFPVRACDFLAESGVSGRGFNEFFLGGYMLWRFWPDRERLPFMDIHQTGTKEDRLLVVQARAAGAAWRELDGRRRFDYALIGRRAVPSGDHLLDFLDADTTWALVFLDDAAAVYVKRGGRDAALAESAYRELPAGRARWTALAAACARDAALRGRVAAELDRQAAGSPYDATAHARLADLRILEGRLDLAREHLRRAVEADPFIPRAREKLGLIALAGGDAREALRQFLDERAIFTRERGIHMRIGQAYSALGDARRAAAHYRRELARDPSNAAARDSLRVLSGAGGR